MREQLIALGTMLLNQAPDESNPAVTGPPIPLNADKDDARSFLQSELNYIFNERRAAMRDCILHSKESEAGGIGMALLTAVLSTALHLTMYGMVVRITALIVAPAVKSMLEKVFEVLSDNASGNIVGVGLTAATATDGSNAEKLFRGLEKAVNELQRNTEYGLTNQVTQAYAGATWSSEAQKACEQVRLSLRKLGRTAYQDQYLAAIGAFAASLAQAELGVVNPGAPNSTTEPPRGTDIFTTKPNYTPGVVSFVLLNDPFRWGAGDEYEVDPDFKPVYYHLHTHLGDLPDAMINGMRRYRLAEWKTPKVIHGLGPYTLRVNEMDFVVVYRLEGPPSVEVALDPDESRAIYEGLLKPAMMKML